MNNPDDPITPPLAVALTEAIRRTLTAPACVRAEPRARAWKLTLMVCETLRAANVRGVPSPGRLREIRRLQIRNQRIRAAFNGRNHKQLALQYGLSMRHVRRIVERPPRNADRKNDMAGP